MKRKIKIAFEDGAIFCQKIIFELLAFQYECFIDQINPDILIYAPYGKNHFKYNCKKLYITPENDVPNFNTCDYAISQNHLIFENRHCRIPFFVFNKEYKLLCNNQKYSVKDAFNRNFCFTCISDNVTADPQRINFFIQLHQKKSIVSMGKELNTIGYVLPKRGDFPENNDGIYTNPSKIQMANKFKFTLALENSCVNGYITEKITDAFIANTIPIYFGANDIKKEFNSKSFINILDFSTFDDAINYILMINNDKTKYLNMLNETNLLHKNYLEILKNFLINCIEGPTFEHKHGRIFLRHF